MRPGVSNDPGFDRQIGCMAGFLQIFDRGQILAAKRPYAPKRLYPALGSTSPSERSEASASSYLRDSHPPPSPEEYPSSPESRNNAQARPLPVFEFKDGGKSSWKLREGPRLSLDSRAVVDGKGKLRPREIRPPFNKSNAGEEQRRSPSVVAKLMGLEALPGGDAGKPAELRRSASESRVPRDASLFRFVDPSAFQKPPPPPAAYRAAERASPGRSSLAASLQRKSFFDAQDFYPEPKRTGSLYGEIERRLRMRGIDEPAKDLETLKQVLEALQLKGLLHSKMHQQEYQIQSCSPPIVVMKAAGKSPRRPGTDPPPPRQYRSSPPVRRPVTPPPPARHRGETERSPRSRTPKSPDRVEAGQRAGPARRRPDNAAAPPPLRRSPVNSPRTSPRRTGPDPLAARSPRNRHSFPPENPTSHRIFTPAAEDDSSTISESSVSNSSHCDLERSRVEDHHRAGRSILERCDKLLSSIAAITSSSSEEQPSPISVLNASRFLGGDEVSPPSAAAVSRSVDFKDQLLDLDEEDWSLDARSAHVDGPEDSDYAYVADVVRETERQVDTADLYAALEKRHPGVSDRRLLFDVVVETVERKRDVPAWQAFSDSFLAAAGPGGGEIVRQVWAEVRRIREGEDLSGDLNDVTCGAIRKDIATAGDGGWGGVSAAEMSNAVLFIERQVFKDLVAEVIRELAAEKPPSSLPRRKLMF